MGERLMEEFAPPKGTRDHSALFLKYSKSFLNKHKHTLGAAAHRGAGRLGDNIEPEASSREEALVRFCEHWHLDTDAEGALLDLHPEEQDAVMEDFKPAPNTANFSSKFLAYVKNKFRNSRWKEHVQDQTKTPRPPALPPPRPSLQIVQKPKKK